MKCRTMHQRLREARVNAGFKTATDAIAKFGWKNSTYRSHENGRNRFGEKDAISYATAFNVDEVWLLLGKNTNSKNVSAKVPMVHKHEHDCSEQIYAYAILLKYSPNDMTILNKIEDCILSQKHKSKK